MEKRKRKRSTSTDHEAPAPSHPVSTVPMIAEVTQASALLNFHHTSPLRQVNLPDND